MHVSLTKAVNENSYSGITESIKNELKKAVTGSKS